MTHRSFAPPFGTSLLAAFLSIALGACDFSSSGAATVEPSPDGGLDDAQLPDESGDEGLPQGDAAEGGQSPDAQPDAPEPPRDCKVRTEGIVIQCEDFDGPWSLSTNLAGYLGDGYVVSREDVVASTVMQGSLQIPEAGTWQVWARGYEYGADRRWQIEVDGTVLAETHDGSSEGFSWQLAGELSLPAAEVSIRVLDAGDGWEVADAIALSRDPEFRPDEGERCWSVLGAESASVMVYDELMSRTRSYDSTLPLPATALEWEQRVTPLRTRIAGALGLDADVQDPPSNVHLLGSTQLDGYRIERLTFEGIPGFTVTANVYVPDGPGPFPVVVSPIGHWDKGKANPTPAARSHALARLGYLSLTYDLFGYGERAVPGNQHDAHWPLILTGHSNAGLQVTETTRALSYLLTRGDVDPTRIGLTGASGGGLATLYTSAVDTRFDVAVPVVYVTQFAELLESGISRCGCSHVPGVASFTNMGEMAGLFAPRPMTIIAGLQDPIFPAAGAQEAEAQARTRYALYGAGDRLQLLLFDSAHDYNQSMREAMYGLFEEVLHASGDGSPVPEPSFDLPPDSAYDCFAEGVVPPSSKTARGLAQDWAEQASSELPGPSSWAPASLRPAIHAVLKPPASQPVIVEPLGTANLDGIAIELLRLEVQPGIVLPGRLVRGPVGSPVVVLADDDRTAFPGAEALRAAQATGWTALHLSVRGRGETHWAEYQTVSDNVLLGDSLLGQRAFDLSQAGRALQTLVQAPAGSVDLLALGPEASLSALFSQALWGEFHAVATGPFPSTFHRAFLGEFPTMGFVAGILHVTDIPHVARLAADHPLLLDFGDDAYLTRYPEWAAWLHQHADHADALDVPTGLAWLSAVRAEESDGE